MPVGAREGYKRGTGSRGRKSRRRRKHRRQARSQWEQLGMGGAYDPDTAQPTDPDAIMGALDELGFSKFLPGRHIAKEVQFQAGKKVARRNELITGESRDMVLGQQRFAESRRPGGFAMMMSPLVSQAAGINLQRRTVAPDLLTRVRDSELHRARKAASDAQTKQLIGGVVQGVGAAIGGVLGGPVGAMAGGAAGGAVGGAVAGGPQQATYGGEAAGGPAGVVGGVDTGAPVVGATGGPSGTVEGLGPQPSGGMAPSPGAPPPGPQGAPGGGGGGPGAPAPGGAGGAPAAAGAGAAQAGGSAGDVAMAMDPSFEGAVAGTLAEFGPEASDVQVFAFDAAIEDSGFEEWLADFWRQVA